jgi:hypothetical protein
MLTFVFFVALPFAAHAQWEPDRATARNLAAEGNAALKEEDFATAEDRFRRADALVHAPTLVVDHARSLIGLGRYVEAQERLELVIREGVSDNAPWVWKRALQDARQLVDEVTPKVGWLTISVRGPNVPEVTVDGVQVPVVALGVRRATDPGSRRIRASAPGYLPTETTISMLQGGEQAVTLELRPNQEENKTLLAPVQSQPPPNAMADSHRSAKRSNAIGYAAIGLGTTGLVVGAVTGVLFLGKHSDLASKCPISSHCDQRDLIDEYNRYGTISSISFGVGIASSVAGIWLLATNKSGKQSPAKSKPVSVVPYVSIGHLGLTGVFQ